MKGEGEIGWEGRQVWRDKGDVMEGLEVREWRGRWWKGKERQEGKENWEIERGVERWMGEEEVGEGESRNNGGGRGEGQWEGRV